MAQNISFLQKESWSAIWNSADGEKENSTDPGWLAQWYEMKKDKDGKIHRLPYETIRKQQENASLRTTSLFNIEELGPKNYGGRTRAILIDKDNSQSIFAGSVSGGIWHSATAGTSWASVDDAMSSLSITNLTQDHFNHDVIYAATGEWSGNSEGIPGNGVYRSMDHGITFSQLPSTDGSEFDYVHRIEASIAQSGRVYISSSYFGLYRSDNFGDSIYRVLETGGPIRDFEITPTGGIWVGVESVGIFYSASGDSGTFTKILNGLPGGSFHRIELAIAPSDTTVIYASFENDTYNGLMGFYKTTDFGQTWNKISNPSVDYAYYMTQSNYSMTMVVKPDDSKFVVFGIGDLVYTIDGGTIWKICLNLHPDHHALVFNPDDPTQFYLGEDGGLYKFNTTQMSYTSTYISAGYHTIQYYAGCYFPSGKNAYAGSQDNGTHSCKDGNGNFTGIFGGDGAYCQVNQQYSNVSYVSYQNGIISRSEDADVVSPTFNSVLNELDANGDNEIDEGAWFINPFEINLVNGDYLGFITYKRMWQTLDGGYSWSPAMNAINGLAPYAIGISREFSPTVYIGGQSAMFYRIDDAYNSFPGDETNLSLTLPESIKSDFTSNITVHPNDNSICYVSYSNYSFEPRLWKVTNAKTSTPTWTSISGDLPAGLTVNYVDVDPAKPDDFFVAGTDYGLYVSDDAGNHWQKIDGIPNVVCYQAKIRASDRRLFVYTHGRGIWTATLDSLNVGVPQVLNQELYAEVFPNPCTDEVNIRSSEKNFSLKIVDVNNKVIFQKQSTNGTFLNPRQGEKINVSSFAAGVYFLELKSENKTVVKKFMKAQ
ncbi:MAG: T9SS type A sorting domain-containing protein [Chitinophagales bacterium]|nr:T9SS type A sorting domain-containing protein [Chitinophagales bacterium]